MSNLTNPGDAVQQVTETVAEAPAPPVQEVVEQAAAPVQEAVEQATAPVQGAVEQAAAPVQEAVEQAAAPVQEAVAHSAGQAGELAGRVPNPLEAVSPERRAQMGEVLAALQADPGLARLREAASEEDRLRIEAELLVEPDSSPTDEDGPQPS